MKKRKLKPAISRRPKNKANIDSIVTEVSKRTGYNKGDIKRVYQAICEVIKDRIWNGQSVIVPRLGTMMPYIRPRCWRNALYGGKKEPKLIEVRPKWAVRFVPMRSVKLEFDKKEVTKEQEDNLYED